MCVGRVQAHHAQRLLCVRVGRARSGCTWCVPLLGVCLGLDNTSRVVVKVGFGPPPPEPRQAARLDLEVSAGWASPSSHGLWGGDTLLLSSKQGEGQGSRAPKDTSHTTPSHVGMRDTHAHTQLCAHPPQQGRRCCAVHTCGRPSGWRRLVLGPRPRTDRCGAPTRRRWFGVPRRRAGTSCSTSATPTRYARSGCGRTTCGCVGAVCRRWHRLASLRCSTRLQGTQCWLAPLSPY
jgi:hypothetical protein